ncbi:MAG: TetR/AcrR family transcriptional regulator [Sphingosinicella sp.]|nr:TetR/AcrR family transcriptional regulator [Sphingosinicella sp.]
MDATIDVVRAKGYTATRIDDIAAAAGVTKGSFFHHFPTKEACARAAADHWGERSEAVFVASGHRNAPTAAARVLAYIDFRIAILEGPVVNYTCYVGTVLEEVHNTMPDLAADCAGVMFQHAKTLEPDLRTALGDEGEEAPDLAVHIQGVIQGALLIAKAEGANNKARASLNHLRRYLEARLKERLQ